MSDYNRTTRECPVSQLHPDLLRAIQSYFQDHKLGDLETETLLCCETTSTKKDFSGLTSMLKSELETTIRTGIILTSQQLIWVLKGDQSTARLTAANLREIQTRPYTSLLAQKFCEEVKKAISIINPEIQRRFPYWMGG